MRDNFSTYHPIINFIYFVFVIGVGMFLMHPVYLCIGLIMAIIYSAMLYGLKHMVKSVFLFALPVLIIVSLINPMFSHYGVTILFYMENGNPVTLESIVYGLFMGIMLCEMIFWFSCFNKVMTQDKLMYLFGRLIPSFSLVLSMCMRFIPRFKMRMKEIRQGQKCVGRDVSNGNIFQKIHYGVKTLSILVTWSLESSIQTADSMHSRGYGLRRRTVFSLYRFDKRDKEMLAAMLVIMALFFQGVFFGYTEIRYNPRIVVGGVPLSWQSLLSFVSFGVFCGVPIFVNIVSEYKWKINYNKIEENKNKKGVARLWNVSE